MLELQITSLIKKGRYKIHHQESLDDIFDDLELVYQSLNHSNTSNEGYIAYILGVYYHYKQANNTTLENRFQNILKLLKRAEKLLDVKQQLTPYEQLDLYEFLGHSYNSLQMFEISLNYYNKVIETVINYEEEENLYDYLADLMLKQFKNCRWLRRIKEQTYYLRERKKYLDLSNETEDYKLEAHYLLQILETLKIKEYSNISKAYLILDRTYGKEIIVFLTICFRLY